MDAELDLCCELGHWLCHNIAKTVLRTMHDYASQEALFLRGQSRTVSRRQAWWRKQFTWQDGSQINLDMYHWARTMMFMMRIVWDEQHTKPFQQRRKLLERFRVHKDWGEVKDREPPSGTLNSFRPKTSTLPISEKERGYHEVPNRQRMRNHQQHLDMWIEGPQSNHCVAGWSFKSSRVIWDPISDTRLPFCLAAPFKAELALYYHLVSEHDTFKWLSSESKWVEKVG
jgi:hypothetical protein